MEDADLEVVEQLKALARSGATVTKAGIKYGSVLYVGFGKIHSFTSVRSTKLFAAEFEVEFGADFWKILDNNGVVLDAGFPSINPARDEVERMLVGCRLIKITRTQDWLDFEFDKHDISVSLRPDEGEEMAAGFLFALARRSAQATDDNRALDVVELQSADAALICTED